MTLVKSTLVALLVWCMCSVGCNSLMRPTQEKTQEPAQIDVPETVGETTRPYGLGTVAIESVGLVTGLPGTGSDPPPSQQRHILLEEMKKRKVENPNQLLADASTALVLVRSLLPPNVKKGDLIDVEVRVPSRSKTTSLDGGWLMETKLREVAILDQEVRSGHVRGVAEGPVLVESMMRDGGDSVGQVRGVVLGGGVATKSRPLGLMLRTEHHHVSISKMVGAAVNRRFDTYVHGKRQGAATPKTDRFIELLVHPRYRNNLIRYLRVVEQITLRETPERQLERVKVIGGELLVPATSALAALRLEAIGDDATPALLRGLESNSAEVRFYASEALAYLDQSAAASHLGMAAEEPAFRSRALLALGAMSSVDAHDQLIKLLDVSSAETRYGAFRALQNMNPRDAILGQDLISTGIALHEVASEGEPMVHIAKTRRPEIVVFGGDDALVTPLVVLVGKSLIIKSEGSSTLRISRYTPGKPDQVQSCPATVNGLVRTLVEIGASYPEIVSAIHEAKTQGCLPARLEFDAIPEAGRSYSREEL